VENLAAKYVFAISADITCAAGRIALARPAPPTKREEPGKMNRESPYPKGSPNDILTRLLRIERDVRQTLVDVQDYNDNNHNGRNRPIDIGRYLVQLKKNKGVISAVRAVIAAGEPKLPSGILDPILEKW
jgi:hypothetical protein